MGFGGQVDDGVDAVVGEERRDEGGIPDVADDRDVPRIPREIREILRIGRVGHLVEIDHAIHREAGLPGGGGKEEPDQIRSDESVSAGNQQAHCGIRENRVTCEERTP